MQQVEEATGVVTTASGGIVPISDALRMAEHAYPVLALLDHRGRPLHLGRAKRTASPDRRLALTAASGGCTRPGCDAPASMTAVHHVRAWKAGGRTDIDNEDLACDACHALVHDGPGGWQTRVAPDGSDHPGRTQWIAPRHIEPEQTPRVNHRHRIAEILTAVGGVAGYVRSARDRRGDGDRGGDGAPWRLVGQWSHLIERRDGQTFLVYGSADA
ncbi:HNH endonuclease [Rhodococcus sp. NPDC003318]|uniref:HNH endonuclease signature motif containing protein n=1 Tax=Rhodococcus sp. NPDC003318 TaxID=3364503 RepID=UPI0036765BD7